MCALCCGSALELYPAREWGLRAKSRTHCGDRSASRRLIHLRVSWRAGWLHLCFQNNRGEKCQGRQDGNRDDTSRRSHRKSCRLALHLRRRWISPREAGSAIGRRWIRRQVREATAGTEAARSAGMRGEGDGRFSGRRLPSTVRDSARKLLSMSDRTRMGCDMRRRPGWQGLEAGRCGR